MKYLKIFFNFISKSISSLKKAIDFFFADRANRVFAIIVSLGTIVYFLNEYIKDKTFPVTVTIVDDGYSPTFVSDIQIKILSEPEIISITDGSGEEIKIHKTENNTIFVMFEGDRTFERYIVPKEFNLFFDGRDTIFLTLERKK